MWIDNSELANDTKVCVSHVNSYQRMESVEEFNNQVGRMTHSRDTSEHLFSVIPVIAPWPHEQNGGRDGGYRWAQQHNFHSQTSPGYGHCGRPSLPAAGPALSS